MSGKKQSQTPVLIVYVITMLVSMVIFGTAAIYLLDVFVTQPKLAREAAAQGMPKEEQEETADTDYSDFRETVLFVGADGGNLNGMAVLRVLPDKLSVRVVPLSPMVYSSVSGTDGTLSSLYDLGGINYLVSGVENALGIECDKYIIISNDGWKSLVEYLGGTSSYNFPQDIYYKNETTGEITSFSSGAVTRTLWGDDIRRIITYPLYDKGNETRMQVTGELAVALINSACSQNSGSIISNMQSIFNAIYNNSDTDITSRTFSQARDAYEYLVQNSTSPATYRMPSGTWDERGYFIINESFETELREYFEFEDEDGGEPAPIK